MATDWNDRPTPAPGSPIVPRWRPLWLRVLRATRFLLIVPIVTAFQRRSDRSLRWRLVGSHLATVLLSVFALALLLSAALLIVNWTADPLATEPASEAHAVASMVQAIGWQQGVPDHDLSVLLAAFATGRIAPNSAHTDIRLAASIGRPFANIRSISAVGPDGRIRSSSDATLVGQPVERLGNSALALVQRALRGETREQDLASAVAETPNGVVGAFPLRGSTADGQPVVVVGAIVVDKDRRSFPGTAFGVTSLAARYAATVGLVLAVTVGVPAILVALVIGINRARSIARPVNDLARAAERLAAGDLSVRVWVPTDDEVARMARAFNRMGDRLQESLEQEADARARAERLLATNRDLVANVSHELRTPVALIRGHIEALADDPARLEAYTEIALRESDRLEDLVNDLFQLARIDAQGLQLERLPFDAGAAAREAVESLAEPARRDAGIVMASQVTGSPADLTIVGDRARLVQVLQNLLRNAVRYTPDGGLIRVVAAPRGDSVVIRVQDTGVGIAPDDLDRVFDRFYRSDQRNSRKGGGAGLGLAIARQSVEAMGGRISVDSTVDEGTVFRIELPQARDPVPVDPGPAAPSARS
jgi:signal transduction histidine kinase